MRDSFGRDISYLRLSVTELCNLRCRYCMPEDGICKKNHQDMLTEDEMVTAVRAAVSLGIRKVRITGGEPLVKRNILSICQRVGEVPGIEELCLTTNGTMLEDYAEKLKNAGVDRLNISIDTLNEKKYAHITRRGDLSQALRGIEAALDAGFAKVKLNTVLIGGFNDDEIGDLASLTVKWPVDVRFIELMPMYDSGDFGAEAFIYDDTVLRKLPMLEKQPDSGVARQYRLPGALGNIGLISPVSAHFCRDCSRIRLTPDGMLKPCLHGEGEYSLKGLCYEEMREAFRKAIMNNPNGTADWTVKTEATPDEI